MTLEQSSLAALAAAAAGDLDALERALEARASAIATGETPTASIFSSGELTLQQLRELRAKLHHLTQFSTEPQAASLDVRV